MRTWDETEIAIAAFDRSGVLLEESLRMGGTPVEVSRLNFVLVYFPTGHFLIVVDEQFVKSVHVCRESM
jgi:hypothetical protein